MLVHLKKYKLNKDKKQKKEFEDMNKDGQLWNKTKIIWSGFLQL